MDLSLKTYFRLFIVGGGQIHAPCVLFEFPAEPGLNLYLVKCEETQNGSFYRFASLIFFCVSEWVNV